jgi:hypothetical protein
MRDERTGAWGEEKVVSSAKEKRLAALRSGQATPRETDHVGTEEEHKGSRA